MTGDARIEENRKRFAAKKRSSGPDDELRRKKGKMSTNTVFPFGEDETSLVAHETWLLAESGKPLPNEKEMESRMALTAQRRIASIARMSVIDMKQKFPYLMDSRRFIKDFETLVKEEVRPKMSTGIDKIVELAMKKHVKCREDELRLLLEASEMDAGKLRTRHIQTVAVLQILAQNVRECAAVRILFVQEVNFLLC
nr:uncharacterized protein LOC126516418 [Dermacentor andersoni]